MARILFVSLALPFPTTNGHRMRNRGILEALKTEGHSVTMVSFAEEEEIRNPSPEMRAACDKIRMIPTPVARNGLREYGMRFLTIASSLPYGVRKFHHPGMKSLVRQELAGGEYDLIVCDDIYMRSNIPEKAGIPILLNKHDLTYEIVERFLEYERNPVKRMYGRLEGGKIRKLEGRLCREAAMVLAVSRRDGELLRSFGSEIRISVVPNVIDVDRYKPVLFEEPKTVLYVGAMDYLANRDAAEYFAFEILPILRDMAHGVTFRVAGRNVPADLLERTKGIRDIEFTGEVKDMTAEIRKATVCVVPLRFGSGTRLKILEACAMEKAVVSTTMGAEGLDFVEGEEIIRADGPEAFARQVAGLLKDRPRRVSLGKAGRVRVEKEYSLQALASSLRSALDRCAASEVRKS